MNRKLIIAIVVSIIAVTHLAVADEIRTEDIESKIILVGKLGKPLGTVVTISGQILSDPKQIRSGQYVGAIRVNKVNGQTLTKAATVGLLFRRSEGIPSVHAHDIIEFSGYESGAYTGTPDDARDLLGTDASPLDWKFETSITVIKITTQPPR
jgi:hypothetical protein